MAFNELRAIATFVKAAELGSLRQAAVAQGITPQAASQALGQLEAHLDVRLFHRTTRSLSLTEEGRAFLEAAQPAHFAVLSAAGAHPAKVLKWDKESWPGMRPHLALVGWFTQLAAEGRIVASSPPALAMAFSSSLQVPHFMRHTLGAAAPELGADYRERIVEMFWRGIEPRD